tara:strand:+ start:360 stop:2036 length:1677 start_codon:yes stop_codon:yes gene_type:complete
MAKEDLSYQEDDNASLELKKILSFFIRQKKIIGIFSIIFLILGIFNATSQKRIWQGDFQIVLDQENQLPSSISDDNFSGSLLSTLNLGGATNSQLKTEIGILKSPSVLIEIFKFVKSEKTAYNKSFANTRFETWINNSLEIALEPQTRILNLKYFDTDKELILPVLNKISEKYQNYSLRKRNSSLNEGLDYFSDQINKFTEKSNNSFEKAQSFGLENGINVTNFNSNNKDFYPITDAENFQSQANLNLKMINSQISTIESLENQDDILTMAEETLAEKSVIDKIQLINTKIASLENIYRDTDIRILNLKKEKTDLIGLLKKSIITSLNVKKQINLSNLNESKRSEKNIIEYKLLFANYRKDLATLNELNNNYRILMLERARKKSPWELITKPTLIPYPVGPSRLKISVLGFIMGFFIGVLVSYFKEKKDDFIYHPKDFETKSGVPIIANIPLVNNEYSKDSLDIFIDNYLLSLNGSKALFVVGKIEKNYLNLIEKQLKNRVSEFIITKDIKKTSMLDNIILITFLGSTKNKELIQITNMLQFNKKQIKGILLINNEAN